MSSPAYQRVLDYPGRLAYGCTDLTAAWPHGGTGLGACHPTVLTMLAQSHPIRGEELAGAGVVDVVTCGEEWSLATVLRDGDNDALAKCLLNAAAGGTTRHALYQSPGTNRAGYSLSSRVTVVVFTPETVIGGYEDAHDMVVFYAALPYVPERLELPLQLRKERGIPIVFWGAPGTSGRVLQMGRRRDLTAVA